LSEFQNPQNQPGIDKRMIIIFAVTMVLLVLAQQFLVKPQQANQQQPAAKNAAASANPSSNSGMGPVTGSAAVSSANQSVAQSAAQSANQPASQPVAALQAASENTTVVENDLYRITFTNRGGLVKSWILKKFNDESGHELDLVQERAASLYGYPLSLFTWDAQLGSNKEAQSRLREKVNNALYVASENGKLSTPGDLSFEYSDGDVAVKKVFHFDNTYVVGVKTSVRRGGHYVTALPAWPAGFGDANGLPSFAEQRIDYIVGNADVQRLKLDKKGEKTSGERFRTDTFQWVGASDAYFGAVFLPEQPQDTGLVEFRNAIQIPKDPANPQGDKVKAEVLGLAVGTPNAPSSVRLFAGPKAVDVLETVHSANGTDLRSTLDFGFFGFIGRPLFAWVRWTQQHWTSNWGWTIVLVTVLINIALLPLRISQIKSSMKMQKVAPQMQQVQEKYKKYKMDDPRRGEMQKEIAALYKEHDVNPIGGCLPVIIQMPFLFAFYTMLRNAIELRHAGWLYLSDLSAPDRYHIIPIATIVLMMVMQRMMPATGMSKEQQKMMNMMTPVMFAMFTWSVASGLGLYIVTGTVVQIVQQTIMNQTTMGREMRAMAEKRALKAAEKKR
jgi:YidC/Oxa1 family membrane protein insertase